MNQILIINNSLIYDNKKLKNKKIYLYLFFIFVSISILLIFYLFHLYYLRLSETHNTTILRNIYNLSTLYPSNTTYTKLRVSNNISIIASIEIPKINISYPIIENTNEELLKISVCKFSGPLPNRMGNLCIAGHNYKNNTMFSNLHKLNIGDNFYITDLNNNKLNYIVYKKFVVNEDDLNCIENSNTVEVTLITCHNNNNSKRLIIKAKMEGC